MKISHSDVLFLLCALMVLIGTLACGVPSRAARLPCLIWDFEHGTAGWTAQHDCTIKAADGMLQINNSGTEPWIHSPKINAAAPALVKIRARSSGVGQGRLYWTVKLPSKQSSLWGEDAVIYLDLLHDGQWHDYNIPIDIDGTITQIRLDPGKSIGRFDVKSIELETLGLDAADDSRLSHVAPELKLSSGALTLFLDTRKHVYTVTDLRTKRVWVTVPEGYVRLVDAKKLNASSMELKLTDRTQFVDYTCVVSLTKDATVRFTLTASDNKAKITRLVYPPRIMTELKNGALVLTQRCNGQLIDQRDKLYPTKIFGCYKNLGLDMPWMGVTDTVTGEGMMALYETPTDVWVDLREDAAARRWPQTRWAPSMGSFSYQRCMSWQFVPNGGYVALAKRFRSYAKQTGMIKTLAQKTRERPKVDWLRGAALIWGGRTDTEFIKQMKAAGIVRALVYGAISKSPSAEEITGMTAHGFLAGEYDNFSDILEGPMGINRDNIAESAYRSAEDKPEIGWPTLGGPSYSTRSSYRVIKVADSFLPALLKTHLFTARFLDVSSALDLYEDYHPKHTFDRRQDMLYRKALYQYMADHGLVVGGEHGKAWNASVLDYNEGMASGAFWWEMPAGYLLPPKTREEIKPDYLRYAAAYDKQIPLWELVFHDCVQSSWYWGDSSDYYYEVAPEICDRKELANMLYGTIPLMWTNKIGYGWDRNRSRFVETYWKTCRLNAVLFGQELKRHEFLSADRMLQRSVFANGATTVVNFDVKPRAYERVMLAPYGFTVTAPGITQSRLMVGEQAVTKLQGKDYLWVQTSSLQQVGAVRIHGKLGLFKSAPSQWNIVVDSTQEANLDLSAYLTPTAVANSRIYELKENGESLREMMGAVKNGKLTIPGGQGLRLYGVVVNSTGG
ncbi:MAG: glycoside hydrolase [Armatimonadota bacterium]